ncbi:MAG: hypothetical protein J7M21_02895, partial [Planctomycetes bacterium]|nr:hypothetical protein [Planctomycetota bacterium]
MNVLPRCCIAAVAGLVVLYSSGAAAAADVHWTAASGGWFEDPAAWDPLGAPGPNDVVIFDLAASAPYTVHFGVSPRGNERCLVGRDDVTLDLGGWNWVLGDDADGLVVGWGQDANAAVDVLGGGISAHDLSVACDASAFGSLRLGGGGSLELSGEVKVGQGGLGELTVAGGSLSC